MQDAVNILPRLRQEHIELMQLSHKLQAYLKTDRPEEGELGSVRGALDHAMRTHTSLEDAVFYPALIDQDDPHISRQAQKFIDEMGTLGSWWADYMRRWPVREALSDWFRFRSVTHHILEALHARVSLENRELFPLVERLAKAA